MKLEDYIRSKSSARLKLDYYSDTIEAPSSGHHAQF
jgi:hypothetical protein